MIIGKIGVAYERKVNLGNYEHCQLAAHVWAGVEEDDVVNCGDLGLYHLKFHKETGALVATHLIKNAILESP